MREIKFRAVFKGDLEAGEPLMFYQKSNEDGEYDKWNLLCKFHPIVLVNEEYHIAYPLELVLSDDDWVVMQYTGLKDKDNKEIYEGDIVEFRGKNYEVIEEFKVFYFSLIPKPTSSDENDFDASIAYLFEYDKEMEVIGNIYEKPELLNITNCDDKGE